MSDVRGLLTETLMEHQLERCSISNQDGFRLWARCVKCEYETPVRVTNAGWEEWLHQESVVHLADVLPALPIHIVGRVEPDWTSEGRYAARWDMDGDTVRLDCFGHIEGVMGETYTRAEARTLATILLSAAATAEEAGA